MLAEQTVEVNLTIPTDLAGLRLDQALTQLLPDYSRERIKQWILDGACTVDAQVHRPRHKVQGGEVVAILGSVQSEGEWQSEELALDIVYEDEDLLIINKAAGMVVHPACGNYSGTLVNGLLHFDPQLRLLPRAGIIHRLDKDTSGLLIVARSIKAHTNLVRMLEQRAIDRYYEALVYGKILAGDTIVAPIGRHPTERTKMAVVKSGKHALTHYRILQRFTAFTHLKVKLETGRTHQIRVHMAHIKHPIVGDRTYDPRRKPIFARQALHANVLKFNHPTTGEPLEFSVELPADMQQLLQTME